MTGRRTVSAVDIPTAVAGESLGPKHLDAHDAIIAVLASLEARLDALEARLAQVEGER
jgi:hypothetical protein